MRLVFLNGPIDQTANGRDWREETSKLLVENGMCAYSPAHAFNWDFRSKEGVEKLIRVNMTALEESDAVISYLLKEDYTVGTFMELQKAIDLGKYVVLVMDDQVVFNKFLYLKPFRKVYTIEQAVKDLVHEKNALELRHKLRR